MLAFVCTASALSSRRGLFNGLLVALRAVRVQPNSQAQGSDVTASRVGERNIDRDSLRLTAPS